MRKEQGMTLIGMLFTVIVLVFAAIIVMKIIPVYLQHYSIVQSIKGLNSTPASSLSGDPIADIEVLKRTLTKRLDINGIEDLTEDQMVITSDNPNKFTVTLKYQQIRPLVYNMSLLFDFNDVEEVTISSEH